VKQKLLMFLTQSGHAGDPDDDKFLDLAVAGNAECIISGARDLQILSPFQGITVMSPADFLAQTSGAG
jgi:predicted nucleic acid-binding protein